MPSQYLYNPERLSLSALLVMQLLREPTAGSHWLAADALKPLKRTRTPLNTCRQMACMACENTCAKVTTHTAGKVGLSHVCSQLVFCPQLSPILLQMCRSTFVLFAGQHSCCLPVNIRGQRWQKALPSAHAFDIVILMAQAEKQYL